MVFRREEGYVMVCRVVSWFGVARCGLVCRCFAWLGAMWRGAVYHDVWWYVVVCRGMSWCVAA